MNKLRKDIMSALSNLKTWIASKIYQNTQQKVTGEKMQEALLEMADILSGIGCLNINEVCNHPDGYETFQDALIDVPAKLRQQACVISYYDIDGQVWIYLFGSDDISNDWEEPGYWLPMGPIQGWYNMDNDWEVKVGPEIIMKVVNNLNSTGRGYALSANQGRLLNEKIEGYDINVEEISTTPVDLSHVILEGDVITSFGNGVTQLVFSRGTQYADTINASDLPFKAPHNYFSVATTSGTLYDVNIHVSGVINNPFINVNDINGQVAAYGSSQLARAAVPVTERILGLYITYLLADGWHIEQFIGSDITNWNTDNNWVASVSVTQNTLSIGGEEKGELAGQLIENPEWIWVCTDNGEKILVGFRKSDGAPIFGYGCPPQVVDYITEHFADYDDIKTFLGNLIDGDTLATLLNAKVDKVTGKSLIDSEFASSQEVATTPEYLQVTTDPEGRIVEGINTNGEKEINIPLNFQGNKSSIIDSNEFIEAKTDNADNLLYGVTKEGDFVFGIGVPREIKKWIQIVTQYSDQLRGKTVVCFGDSITENMGDDGLRYSDIIAKITGANVINVGIGGSQLRQRHDPVIDPEAGYLVSNYAALDIVNMVRSACGEMYNENTSYLSLAEYAAQYIYTNMPSPKDDNRQIVKRLSDIDWNMVDVVTVFGGTNDWTAGNRTIWGESGSSDVNTTLGAVNEIIRLVSSVNPKIRLYWFTPIVRWLDYSGAGSDDNNFSDVAEVDTVTLKAFSQMIFNEVTLSHIPISDIYNTLGINKYNFSRYFHDNDGTHPKDYSIIAKAFIGFILTKGV